MDIASTWNKKAPVTPKKVTEYFYKRLHGGIPRRNIIRDLKRKLKIL